VFCAHCGTNNADEATTCSSCGVPLAGTPATPNRSRFNRGPWLAAGIAAAVVVAVGAGSWFFIRDSGGNKFDPARASEYAHRAMIPASDFPGTGWTITSVDDFTAEDPSNNPLFTGASCSAVKAQTVAYHDGMNPDQAGKAVTAYSQGANDVTASIEVSIQKDTRNISSDMASYRQAMQHVDMPKCLESFLNSIGADAAKVTSGSPSTGAPKGGIATAYDLTFSVQGQPQSMRIEDYAWVYSNAIVHVSFTGTKEKLGLDAVVAAVSKTQALLEKVASGPFSTPVPVR